MQEAIKHYLNKDIINKLRLQNGWKESWLLTLSDGEKVVFRASEDYTDFFERERFFYNTVNQSIGKVCPQVYVVDGSLQFSEKAFQISEYIQGDSFRTVLESADADKKMKLYYELGQATAKINQIKVSSFDEELFKSQPWILHYTNELMKPQLLRIVDNKLITIEQIEQLCEKLSAQSPIMEHSLLHRDIRPDNIICNDDKMFVIDAETCELGDPLNELARINLQWHYWENYDSLLNGYKEVLNVDTECEMFYYYQLEQLAEILDMHHNHGCMNSTTPYFKNKFKQIIDMLL
ncbi:MAG: aminoglycoside phosphotransferase family protein [Clostridia bacterium]|nr:aminoglycoside phosphotransferase family protein [Clostridia bacterium]